MQKKDRQNEWLNTTKLIFHRIERSRELQKMSYKKLAALTHLSESTLRRWKAKPSSNILITHVFQVCHALNLNIIDLCLVIDEDKSEDLFLLEISQAVTDENKKQIREKYKRR